ncbi:hypothetical protein KEM54_002102 [Ascosphaera aggregata]|nr:hypothetical protein KEM54_002102 [Ascosphaera aggregata]
MLAAQRPLSMTTASYHSNASFQSLPSVQPRSRSSSQNLNQSQSSQVQQRRQSRRGSLYRQFSRAASAGYTHPRTNTDSQRLLADNIPDLEQYINDCLAASGSFSQSKSRRGSSPIARAPRLGAPSRQNSPTPSSRRQPQPRFYAGLNQQRRQQQRQQQHQNLINGSKKEASSSANSHRSTPSATPSVDVSSPLTYSSTVSSSSRTTGPQSRPCSTTSGSNNGVFNDSTIDGCLAPPSIGMMSEQASRSDPSIRPRAVSYATTPIGVSRRRSFFSSANSEAGDGLRRRGTFMRPKWNNSQPILQSSTAASATRQGSSPLRSAAMQTDEVPPSSSEGSGPPTFQKKKRSIFRLFKRNTK